MYDMDYFNAMPWLQRAPHHYRKSKAAKKNHKDTANVLDAQWVSLKENDFVVGKNIFLQCINTLDHMLFGYLSILSSPLSLCSYLAECRRPLCSSTTCCRASE